MMPPASSFRHAVHRRSFGGGVPTLDQRSNDALELFFVLRMVHD
jgi:hypothetical protein